MFSSKTPLPSRSGNIHTAPSSVVKHSLQKPLRYPHRLNFYNVPPSDEITIEDFEIWAIDRLKVLAEIEASIVRGRSHEELAKVVAARCKEHLPLSSNTAQAADLDAERKRDHYGHFVLRLAFCRSEELRARFTKSEAMLFRVRFESDDADERQRFLRTLNFDWVPVPLEEKEKHKAELMAASKLREDDFQSEVYVKVYWTRVPDLVATRRIFLRGGWAFVPLREQASLVLQEFSSRLSRALDATARQLPHLDEDSRLLPVLEHLSMGFLAGVSGLDFTTPADGEAFTAEMVDDLARQHFPLCMRNLWMALRRDKHMKHGGRQQFSLFLKGIGLSIDEAIVFWRKSLTLKGEDRFNKEYRYNIRHNYGLEGSRRQYQPKSCQQIIKDTPGPSDSHGCPFRHFNEASLSQMLLTSCRVSNPADAKEIFSAVQSQHYHVACTRVFELTHADKGVAKGEGLGNQETVSHPNRYFQASFALSKPKEEAKAEPKQVPMDTAN